MALVIDASVVARWYLNVEGADRAEALADTDQTLVVPDLVLAEVANALWKAVAFAGESAERAGAFLHDLAHQFDELVPTPNLVGGAWTISLALHHPVYACLYLALAEARACRLITADQRLLRRCEGTRFASLIAPL
jgi:predicted nucleic acid-binding protein